MLSHFYRADYLRLSKIDEVGNISTIYETDYNTIAVENGIHDWIYVTDNENLVGSMYNYKQPGKNGFELTIRYLKCDEAAEVAGSTDVYFANSYDLLSLSDGWYSNGADPFYVTGELIGIFYYPYYSVETYYTDDEYLRGEIRALEPLPHSYHIHAEGEFFAREDDGNIYRNGTVVRDTIDKQTGNIIEQQTIRVNHAKVMYDMKLEGEGC